jgi:uncharacterized protein (TIGR00251 family)
MTAPLSGLRADGDAVLLPVRVTPRAGRNAIAGERDGRVLIRITAPPLDGRANDALCRLLAKTLGLGRGRVTVAGGAQSRDKLIRVDGITPADAAHRLGLTGPAA